MMLAAGYIRAKARARLLLVYFELFGEWPDGSFDLEAAVDDYLGTEVKS